MAFTQKTLNFALKVSGGLLAVIILWFVSFSILKYAGSPWNLMREQPSIRSQERPPLSIPEESVPFLWNEQNDEDLPLLSASGSVKVGKRVYRENCAFCHGMNGQGDGPVAQYLKYSPENLTSGQIQWRKQDDLIRSIRQPIGIMPSFLKRLTAGEIWSVGEYVLDAFALSNPPPWREFENAEPVVAGKVLYESLNCNRCHGPERKTEAAGIPPTLEYAGSKIKNEWMVDFLLDPYTIRWKKEGIRPDVRMPAFRLERWEAQALAAYLSSFTDEKRFSPELLNGQGDAEKGKELFEAYQCLGCHTLNGRGNSIGPDLSKVGSRLKPGYLFGFLIAPQKVIPGTAMKDFDLWDEEARDLVRFLQTLK